MVRHIVLACFLFAVPAAALSKPLAWHKITGPHFTVYAQGDDAVALDWAVELETYFQRASSLVQVDPGSRPPLTIVLFENEAQMKPFKARVGSPPVTANAYCSTWPTGAFFVTHAKVDRRNVRAVLYHTAFHWLVGARATNLPPWYSEGVAELFAGFAVTGNEAELGSAIPEHLGLLRTQPLLKSEDLMAVGRTSVLFDEVHRSTIFYAQAWALVHWLVLDGGEATRRTPAEYFATLENGAPKSTAFESAFHMTPAEMDRQFNAFIKTGKLVVARWTINRSACERAFATSTPTDLDVDVALGHLAAALQLTTLARSYLQRALASDPANLEALIAMGRAAIADRKFEEARLYADKAVATHPDAAMAYYLRNQAYVLSLATSSGGLAAMNPAEARPAVDDLAHALRLAPDNTTLYQVFAGLVPGTFPRTDADYALLEQGLIRAPLDAQILATLASMDIERNRKDQARERMKRILALPGPLPDNVKAFARAYLANAEVEEVRQLIANKDYPEARRRIAARLQDLPVAQHALWETMNTSIDAQERFDEAQKLQDDGDFAGAEAKLRDVLQLPQLHINEKLEAQTRLKQLQRAAATK